MVKDIIVYGTGGTSLEVLETLEQINQDGRRWNILGFVDDNPELAGQSVIGYPVLGLGAAVTTAPLAHAAIAIGIANDRNPGIRRGIRERLAAIDPLCGDERFPAIVHPTATLSPRAKIGAGTVLLTGASISLEVVLGRHVLVMQLAHVGHHSIVEDYAVVGTHCSLGGLVRISAGAYLGMGCTVRPRVRIGEASRVGMGAAVVRDVPDGVTVAGVPARPLLKTGQPLAE